jgi:hypothetical protein
MRLQPTGRTGLLRAVGRNSREAVAWRLGPAGKIACVARGNAHTSRAVARSPVARRWLDGGKVLSASTGGVPGRRQARRAETGLTEMIGRWWGGGKRSARRCSTATGSLRWSPTRVAGSCSSRETRGCGGGGQLREGAAQRGAHRRRAGRR